MKNQEITVVGAGLAGSECAFQLAQLGYKVKLIEQKSIKKSPAHTLNTFAELVCSNSFRSDSLGSAVGIMHQELRELDSIIIKTADKNKVPAGDALAVDRNTFSTEITEILNNHPNITIIHEEFKNLKEYAKDNIVVIATGPLSSEGINQEILEIIGEKSFNFFDAIAPIVYKDSIDFSQAWWQSRYEKGNAKDYINCSMTESEYEIFYNELINAEYMEFEDWEKDIPYFEGCLPIEVMAKRGKQTLLFGPFKPVGLVNPHTSEQPFAVLQLRQDNSQGSLYNMVGCQTKLKYNEQTRIFKLIPALKNVEFAKLGSIHKNTFINSPLVLNNDLSLKNNKNIFFAGQITGCEGYVESTSVGLMCALFVNARIKEKNIEIPKMSSMGAILNHILESKDNYQPSNINFGLFPEIKLENVKKIKKADKKELIMQQSLSNIKIFKGSI
ncbi:MAG: methylenetetrahydrofolate--tRNA-(uracil(54)-C(5))-methyltransferase (FADH(2)-oxidizing) TrmFO [Alphaproteobacteria bacterium]|jgi:methylenetetrahydrofolate--tRNA-(uracil-5-)-methyltransferase|nr:methylenetetrahydrofolate--tRNA-(uracil(54)-C(5))-methyltransferase (FADH(2)-oxidizing) TrmFO [Alphaproteobacteria bacterium]